MLRFNHWNGICKSVGTKRTWPRLLMRNKLVPSWKGPLWFSATSPSSNGIWDWPLKGTASSIVRRRHHASSSAWRSMFVPAGNRSSWVNVLIYSVHSSATKRSSTDSLSTVWPAPARTCTSTVQLNSVRSPSTDKFSAPWESMLPNGRCWIKSEAWCFKWSNW